MENSLVVLHLNVMNCYQGDNGNTFQENIFFDKVIMIIIAKKLLYVLKVIY